MVKAAHTWSYIGTFTTQTVCNKIPHTETLNLSICADRSTNTKKGKRKKEKNHVPCITCLPSFFVGTLGRTLFDQNAPYLFNQDL